MHYIDIPHYKKFQTGSAITLHFQLSCSYIYIAIMNLPVILICNAIISHACMHGLFVKMIELGFKLITISSKLAVLQ